MKKITLITIIIGSMFLLNACSLTDNKDDQKDTTGIANPASVYCEEQGGKLEIRKDEAGAESGYCLFDDGSECEEWDFYNKKCDPRAPLMGVSDDEKLGGECGTVSPDSANECCVEKMKDEPAPGCVGKWLYSTDNVQCEYTCDEGEVIGGECGTVTPDQADACCEEKMKDELHPECEGDWKYDSTKAQCKYKCEGEEIIGGDCGTVTPDQADACCTEKMKSQPYPSCEGKWLYNAGGNLCEYKCNEDIEVGIQAGSPAAEFCARQGGTGEPRTGKSGGESSYCVFPDGTECEEWAYYRGECSAGGSEKQLLCKVPEGKSHGWYRGDTLIKEDPHCYAEQIPECYFAGSRSEGWYIRRSDTRIEFTFCSQNDQIPPVCITDDPDSSKGWYRGEELVKEDASCGETGTEAEGDQIGSRSEGCYKPVVDTLIEYTKCSE